MSNKPNDTTRIPMVNIVGPGSQPQEPDGVLDYMPMPKQMDSFQQPMLPEPDEPGDISGALEVLDKVASALANYPAETTLFDLHDVTISDRNLINQVLGVGEVSARIEGPAPIEIQESVMAGLWRVHHLDTQGQVLRDCLEVGDIPDAIRQLAFQSAARQVNTDVAGIGGLINAPAMLVELDDQVKNHRPELAPHVINLSLLPLSPDDVQLVGERLGVGPVTILSRGYGNCRIGTTACQSVWWIKYYNSEDALILNTIEVVAIPEVAMAAPEDIADSAHRLREILDIYQ